MNRFFERIVTTSIIVLIASANSWGFRPPKTLTDLYKESDLIVVADVIYSDMYVDIDDLRAGNYDDISEGSTSLMVKKILKGKIDYNNIKVYHPRYMICSYPNFRVGKRILAFLSIRDDGSGYVSSGHAYGIKHPDEVELKTYLNRIDELSIILEDNGNFDRDYVDWLVLCAENMITRRDAVVEFDRNKWAHEQNPDKTTDYSKLLTTEHISRLYEAVGGPRGINYIDDGLIDYLREIPTKTKARR